LPFHLLPLASTPLFERFGLKGSRQKRASAVLAETAGALFSEKKPFQQDGPRQARKAGTRLKKR
jgi:hypothetical protein